MGVLYILILLIGLRFTMYCRAHDLTMIALTVNAGLKIHFRTIRNCIYNIKKKSSLQLNSNIMESN